ncbi:histidine kinase,response regulator receiver domain,GAF domain-containing protein [Desulfotignum phosphitoxidans DSM 13687]|uniref:histidine kinase n=2 Tax=Desulfotignum phosphitoxidans TaxID=190898 RepID=S0G3I4_9BACT|nr:histidine kinase,response regulator receiver domain,GAF domain-containing protein [Desulfotignum phosphitoxidans DSM 13687]
MAFTFLAIILLSVSIYSYNVKKSETLSLIDNKLFVAALSIKNLLPKDFHDRAKNSEAIAAEEDWQNIKAISEFTNRAGCTFLYTLVQDDDAIYITASSATKEELDQNVEVRYFTHFKEADENFHRAFDSGKAYSFTHEDRWGTFRAMAVPELSPDGKVYLAVAELEISDINKILKSNVIETIIMAILVICGSLPIFYLLLNRFRQISEKQKKTEQQLQQAQKMESVGRLAGGVAHDFNNMLGVILGHTELALLQADENHELHDDLKEIQKAAKRSADITKQLLAFARKQTISPKKIDLNDTVESMLNMLRRLIGEDIDLVWQPGAHLWPVKMDPSQIDQILANLCVNARDAISGVGKLTIETGRKTFDEEYCKEHAGFIPGEFVLLAVSDNGCGMDKDILDNLFEPFFTTKEVGKGTGLGLATIYGIVKQNNGFINVYSEPGQGSTFKIYLPRLVDDKETDKAVPEKKVIAGGTETILLVEDEPSILRMTRMMLERKGYTVLSAATPSEAVEKAKSHSGAIDLLMTDVVMSEMNGRDLSRQITDLYPDIRLLFMSGYTANVIAHQGILDDGVSFIQKPFSMADMTENVRKLLDMTSDKS